VKPVRRWLLAVLLPRRLAVVNRIWRGGPNFTRLFVLSVAVNFTSFCCLSGVKAKLLQTLALLSTDWVDNPVENSPPDNPKINARG
jgi:hypothetical protein